MMIKAVLVREDGKELGRKTVPDDCLVLRYGGGTFARVSTTDPMGFVYQMTDTYHFHNVDQE